MNIKELGQATSSNFVSSDLIDDTGIVVDDPLISKIVMSTGSSAEFAITINGLTIDTIVPVYNFFDAYCINPAFMEIVRHRLHVLSDNFTNNYDTIIFKKYAYMASIQLDVPFRKINEATKFMSNGYDSPDAPYVHPIRKVIGTISSEKVEVYYNNGNNIAIFIFDSFGKVIFVKGFGGDCDYQVCLKYETRN